MLPLEDNFCDILAKALQGMKQTPSSLALKLGVAQSVVQAWLKPALTTDLKLDTLNGIAELLELDAGSLAASAADAWHPKIALPESVSTYVQSPQPSNGYVLASGDACAVVDPAGDVARILSAIVATRRPLTHILMTHRHADHSDAAAAVAAAFPQARLTTSRLEYAAVPSLRGVPLLEVSDETFAFGETSIRSQIVAGHTAGLCIFHYENVVFVGDAMFAGSIGRAFETRVDYAAQRENIHANVLNLAPQTIILSGHGPASSVEAERLHNPFFAGRYQS